MESSDRPGFLAEPNGPRGTKSRARIGDSALQHLSGELLLYREIHWGRRKNSDQVPFRP